MEATARPGGLPAPTGPHAVGRTSSEWADTSRPEIYSSDPGDHREFVVWIWYPATAGHNAEPTMYLPQSWAPVGDFLGLDTAGVTGHAMADPPVAGDGSEHPVLVLSPSGFSPLLLTAVAEEIASHGYVVVGVNHTYESTVTAVRSQMGEEAFEAARADGRAMTFEQAVEYSLESNAARPHEQRAGRAVVGPDRRWQGSLGLARRRHAPD